jgi:ureidoacrylate peracid hydrolase
MHPLLPAMVDPAHTALLVVDVQNAYIHGQGRMARAGLDVSLMQEMVPRLEDFLALAREVEGLTIIFLRGIYDEWTASPVPGPIDQRKSPMPPGDWETEFYVVAPREGERVVSKPRYGGFEGTDLDLILRGRGIQTLIMTGVGTNVCVETTARDGYQKNYGIVFLKDCTATTSAADHEATLRTIGTYFGLVVKASDVVAAWHAAAAPAAPAPAASRA